MKKRNIMFAVGRFFSPLYSLLMLLRETMYSHHLFSVTRLGVPVISVGNLTLGGTGKTPMVQYIARILQAQGRKPAIISRGYGGSTREKVNVVSAGEEPLLDAGFIGDEPRLLAETLPGVLVLTGVSRKFPAARAVELGADVLILDDGFQHLALGRDLDLVLFNADTLAGNSRVFPGGDLREPTRALRRCHGFVLTGTCEANRDRAQRFAGLLRHRFPGRPVFFAQYQVDCLVQLMADGQVQAAAGLLPGEEPCFGFSGIARPESFQQTLAALGIKTAGFCSLPDHFRYRGAGIKDLVRQAEQCGAGALITTEKDLVKLRRHAVSLPLYAVRMKVVPDRDFDRFVLDGLAAMSSRHCV
ncbi:MAG TPA: tetraacyldisaccharide 4'-kinase [Desulfobacteraceae bacterium]|nr:tetraacyldisaccharide 4'-kinase [Desulfobacteraceae bacterium]